MSYNPTDVVPIIENLCATFDEKIEMVLMKSKLLKKDPETMLKLINKIYAEAQRDEDLISIMLKLKIQAKEQGDKFEMSKDLMIEVEELANGFKVKDACQNKVLASARAIILSQMLKAGRVEIAKGYLKKQMLSKAGDQQFLNALLRKVSKLTFDSTFLMEVIQRTVIDDIDPTIFSNALLSLEFIEDSLEKKCEVFSVMLKQPKYSEDPLMWVKYIYFLGTNGEVNKAKQ